MPFKVTDFCTNRKLIYDFLLVINTNLLPVLHRFRDIAIFVLKRDVKLQLTVTLNDLERHNGRYFELFQRIR